MAAEKPILVKLLTTAGYVPRVAKALAWLVKHEAGIITSRELEIGANLRQPEAHYAINIMNKDGWLTVLPVIAGEQKRGRPEYRYQYALTKEQAVGKIQREQAEQRQKAIAENLEQIRAAIMGEAGV
jgi:predicted transcriptional regulator